jgi:hypothetical protein
LPTDHYQMIDAMRLCGVVGDRAARSFEPVVETDTGGEQSRGGPDDQVARR